MCTGTTTLMTCGHKLTHYISYCSQKPRPCSEVSGPVDTLNDTCAKCHPPALVSHITIRHDAIRNQLMAKLRQAGSRDEELALEKNINDAERERRRELRAANSVRWEGVVEWPGLSSDGGRVQQGSVEEALQKSLGIAQNRMGQDVGGVTKSNVARRRLDKS